MPSSAVCAFGTTLSWNGGLVAEVREFNNLPQRVIDALSVFSHDSLAGADEIIGGMIKEGPLDITGVWVPGDTDGQIAMYADSATKTKRATVITFPTALGTTLTFTGLITNIGLTAPINGEAAFRATIQPSGLVALGVTASTGLTTLTGADSAAGALDFVPNFATGTLVYVVPVATGITYVKLTPAGAGTITITSGGATQVVPTTTESAQIPLGAAQTVTEIEIEVKEASKAAVVYTIYVSRV